MAEQLNAEIKLTRGVPPMEALPCQAVAHHIERLLAEHGPRLLQYQPSIGFAPLRAYLAEQAGCTADEVIVGNGSLQLLALWASACLRPGDTVVVERPTYDRALTTLRQAGLRIEGVPLTPEGPDVDALRRMMERTQPVALYTIPDFQNPTGITAEVSVRREVARLAREHLFHIVEDIPYRQLRYAGEEIPTYREILPERTIQLSSFSKLLAPGLRVGWMVASTEIIRRVARLAEDTYITPALLGQGVCYAFAASGELELIIDHLKGLYRPRLRAMLTGLACHLPQASWTNPKGGFFVGLTLPEGVVAEEFAAAAAAHGVQLTDSRGFFPDGHCGGFVRLPFCALSEPEIEEALVRLAQAVAQVTRKGR